jgi:hypothetical protein
MFFPVCFPCVSGRDGFCVTSCQRVFDHDDRFVCLFQLPGHDDLRHAPLINDQPVSVKFSLDALANCGVQIEQALADGLCL